MDIGRRSVSPVRRHTISLALVAAGIAAFLLWWASPAAAATFTVNSANDVDDTTCDVVHCSLREAINAANASAGLDTIAFNITGLGVQTITPAAALPTITDPVLIDGYTQPGASANTLATGNDAVLLIELNGTSAGSPDVDGLNITGGGSTVQGLAINRFSGDGIELSTAMGNNVITGNFIGTNAAGTTDLGNTTNGMHINGSPNNTIGGTAPAARNVISGNDFRGVQIINNGATGNTVLGNYIGTSAAGTADLGNTLNGVFVFVGPNTVGGTAPGAGNVISGNDTHAVNIGNPFSGGTALQGNYIGTNASGTAALANAGTGVLIGSPNNTIGGSAAGARNVISGNFFSGVEITGSFATGNIVSGNYLGTNASGTAAIGNGTGVRITSAPNNTVGGTAPEARNVISGNATGVLIINSTATGNTVLGNYIGTDVAGTADLGNGTDGVRITGSPNNTIGGTASGAGNLISGNNLHGIDITNPGATGNAVLGNYIGTDATGALDLGNTQDGVFISNGAHTIGGTAAGARNVISGNNGEGVEISSSDASGNSVLGNYIGTNAAGAAAVGNTGHGIRITGSSNNTVGGTTAGAGNVISGNASHGVFIQSFGATGNTVQGNNIGTDVTGAVDLGNTFDGVQILEGTSNTVGGTAAGARNVISGNNGDGVRTAGVNGATIQGNYIGTNAVGDAGIGNNGEGVHVSGSANILVGGTAAGAGNVISANGSPGIQVEGCCGTNTIQGNYIGTNAAGTAALGNSSGVVIFSANVQVGGAAAGARNVISGNNNDGIAIFGSASTVQGNYIGTDLTGAVDLGNASRGLVVTTGGNTIGGTAAGAGNVISGNASHGLEMQGAGATGNTVQGNYIGTNATGTDDLGNSAHGISISGGPPSNTIGGTAAGAGNTIAFNGDSGVIVSGGSGNAIRGNLINLNADLGIDLVPAGVTANDTDDPDTGPNELQNFPEITGVFGAGSSTTVEGTLDSTPNTDFDLDFFSNDECDASGHGEGQNYLGSFAVSTDSNGDASFSETVPGPVGAGQFVTAAATDPNGNTSEFSACSPQPPIVVNSSNDPGTGTCDATECTLREAINRANAAPGGDEILFDVGSGPVTISPVSPLPTITDPVVIDGTSQPGFSGDPIVELSGTGAGVTADGLRITSGNSAVEGLVINRFGGDGIELLGGGGNTIRGNYLGTDATGGVDLGNGQNGLRVNGSSSNLIGGAASGAGNLISGNNSRGVALLGSGATGNLIRGNLVGTDALGTADLGNGVHGVAISTSASNNTIGGQGPNTMAFNGDDGVWVGSGTGNRVLRNSIHSNDGLGIDVGADGVTPNDAGDEDTGANMLQNFPVLDAALVGGGATAVFGTLESEADTDYRLHFWHSPSCDPSGNGEGQHYLGNKLVSTDSDGLASFRATFAQIAQNRQVTAVAVDPEGNTSEFSACEPTTLRPTLAIDDVTVTEGNSGTTPAIFTVTRSGNTGGTSTVNFATANVTAVAPGDYATSPGTLTFASGETTKTITVNVVGDVLDEPNETFRVNLSAPVDATISDSQGIGTITDDDPTPTLSINDVTVVEGDSGTARPIFTVSLSGASGQTVTVNYATANGTATAPGDYTAKSGTLSFSPGVTTQTITVRVNGDNAVEPDETYFVNLSGATNATISDGQGQGTIQNDD